MLGRDHRCIYSQLSTDEILDDVVGSYLDQLFGDHPDTNLLAGHVIGRAHCSHKKAEAMADAYNAFSLAVARERKRNWADQATVAEDSKGIYRVRVQP